MAVIQRKSPGILGIAFAVMLGLLMFTLCVPICSTACGIAGLAGLVGLGSLSELPDSDEHAIIVDPPPSEKAKRKRTPIAVGETKQQESQAVETLDPMQSDQDPEVLVSEREAELQEEQVSDEPEEHQPLVQPNEEYVKAQARVARVCPDSLIPEETKVRFTDF